jgi:hypothetical protein
VVLNDYQDTLMHPNQFYGIPFQMQLGVYLAYYDSLNIDVYVDKDCDLENGYLGHYECFVWDKDGNGTAYYDIDHKNINHPTRNEAYKEAFKKADELVNKEL